MKKSTKIAGSLGLAGLLAIALSASAKEAPERSSGLVAAMAAAVVSPTVPAVVVGTPRSLPSLEALEVRARGALAQLREAREPALKVRAASRLGELANLIAARQERQAAPLAKELRAAASQHLRAAALVLARKAEPDWTSAAELIDTALTLGGDRAQLKAALERCELEAWARAQYKEAFAILGRGAGCDFAQARSLLEAVPDDSDVGLAARLLAEQARGLESLGHARDALRRRDRKAAAAAAREALENPELPGYATSEAREILRRTGGSTQRPGGALAKGMAPPPLSPYATARVRAEAFARVIQ